MAARTDNRVAIIGGGIAGLTTAILLHANGYRTELYTKLVPSNKPDESRVPEFASLHAAASVLPHSVRSPNVERWTSISQHFFRALSFRATCGVRTQVHYEICEAARVGEPEYAAAVDNFEMLSPAELSKPWVPRRRDAANVSGWRFDAFFCEAPEYVRHLYSLYKAIGGRVEDTDLPGTDILAYLGLNYRYDVNCTGSSAHEFIATSLANPAFHEGYNDDPGTDDPVVFERLKDDFRPKLIRGHYLRVDIKDIVTDKQGRFFSYNYKPTTDIYCHASGEPADVYCYPRSDAWILGGSRQIGTLETSGEWTWETTVGAERAFDKVDGGELSVPRPIFDLNAELLLRMTEGRLDIARLYRENPSVVSPGIGYRFVRESDSDSVRVNASRLRVRGSAGSAPATKYVLHNYGHGGSGFTLSWGCAFQVLEILGALSGHDIDVALQPQRRKFLDTHEATKLLLLAVTRQLALDK